MPRRKSWRDIGVQSARLFNQLGGGNFFAEDRSRMSPRQQRVLEIRDRYMTNIHRAQGRNVDFYRPVSQRIYMGLNNG